MCGICGVVATDERTAHEYDLARFVRPMMAAMHHRGPDEGGHLDASGIALGMRRLSIVDRETSSQPMYNEDRTIAVVTNGEIYNFAALRRELIAEGHHFRSRGDTETIVHAYEQWGDAFLTHLRGMFALAVYDAPRRRLVLGRDRLGIKPLYYSASTGISSSPPKSAPSSRAASSPESCHVKASKAICCSAPSASRRH